MDKKTFLCPYCQEELIEGAKFCKKCGARLNVCPDCGHPLKPEAQFCPKCGARLVSLSAMEENRHTADSPEAPAYEPPGKPVPAVPEYRPADPHPSSTFQGSSRHLGGLIPAIIGGAAIIAIAAGIFFLNNPSRKEPKVPIAGAETSSSAVTPPTSETGAWDDTPTDASAAEPALSDASGAESAVPSDGFAVESAAPSDSFGAESAAAGLSSGTQDYILPESNSRLLTESDLTGLSKEELRLARNEIYARYGRKFKDTALQDYFDSKPWYQGTEEPAAFDARQDAVLSKTEIANLDFIKAHENLN